MVRYQCPTVLHTLTGQNSFLRTIRERDFHVLSFFLISETWETTSSMVGRFVGSSWTMSAMSPFINSNPWYFWPSIVRTSSYRDKRNGGPPYIPPELGSRGSKHQWGKDCMTSCPPEVRALTYPPHVSERLQEARLLDRTGGKGQSL